MLVFSTISHILLNGKDDWTSLFPVFWENGFFILPKIGGMLSLTSFPSIAETYISL